MINKVALLKSLCKRAGAYQPVPGEYSGSKWVPAVKNFMAGLKQEALRRRAFDINVGETIRRNVDRKAFTIADFLGNQLEKARNRYSGTEGKWRALSDAQGLYNKIKSTLRPAWIPPSKSK